MLSCAQPTVSRVLTVDFLITIIPSGQITENEMTAGRRPTQSTWKNTLEHSGLVTKRSGGKQEEWIPNIRSSICATLAEDTLVLPTESIKFQARPMHPHKGF